MIRDVKSGNNRIRRCIACHKYAIDVSDIGELVAVCDVNEALKTKYPDVPFYTDVEAMLEKEDLDVVHICLPHYLHYPVTKLCRLKKACTFSRKNLWLWIMRKA